MNNARRGFTLIELILAAVIGVIIVAAMGHFDVTRILMTKAMSPNTETQGEAELAELWIEKQLQLADRVHLINSSNIQFRIPRNPLGNLNDPTNYEWSQIGYRAADTSILYLQDIAAGDCSPDETFRSIQGLTIQFKDEAQFPPGGEPPTGPLDSNVLEVTVVSTQPNPADPAEIIGEVTLRGGAYTNVTTGLAPPGVSEPPGGCVI